MSDIGSSPDDALDQWFADLHQKPEQPAPEAILRDLTRAAASWDLTTRLAVRAHPVFNLTDLRHRVQKLVLDLGRAGDLTRDLDLAPDLARDLARARARALARDVARDLALARDLARDFTRDLNLVRNVDLVRALVLDLVRALDLVLERTHARDRALAHAHAVGLTLTYGLSSFSFLALGFSLSFANALALARTRCLDLYRGLVLARDRALALDRALDRGGATNALIELHNVLSDVTDVDLRGIDLTGIVLPGLRWSVGTRWPPQWEYQIRRDSVEVADGIFQVKAGTAYASTQALRPGISGRT